MPCRAAVQAPIGAVRFNERVRKSGRKKSGSEACLCAPVAVLADLGALEYAHDAHGNDGAQAQRTHRLHSVQSMTLQQTLHDTLFSQRMADIHDLFV